uniref:Cytochrome P450 n=1 Tax=Kwoniella dejecticola CBS 10117 TaxID=1296121 RepID=A0A1A6A622_9TREE|nr:uncharacterized protein I303_04844 [Kwoniella dejecticola CBS 10117]OBR85508.1 hypothetical protein I303_04844 [Kwoniella dejecticola CBS 10117]
MNWLKGDIPPISIPHTLQEALPHIYLLVGGGIALYLLSIVFTYIGVLRQVRGLPTRHGVFPAWEVGLRPRLPHIPYLFPVKDFYTKPEFDIYQNAGSDLLAFTVLALPSGPVYFIGSPSLAKHVCTKPTFGKASFEKRYENIRQFGSNIVSAYDGEEHRHHKNVIRGCFGEQIFEKVWEKMTGQVEIMLCEEGVKERGGVLGDIGHLMIKVTFAVIGEVGFSEKIPWRIEKSDGKGEMPFVESMEAMDESLLLQFLMPSWVLKVVPSLRRYGVARRDYLKHTHRLYQHRRNEIIEEDDLSSKPPKDILGALAHAQITAERASQQPGAKGTGKFGVGLTEEEVISDMCEAGHETTGHTLAFILANLALYPDWQEGIYEEIKDVRGEEEPSYKNMNQLQLTLAFCLESLRQNDSARLIFKYAIEDSLVPYTTWDKNGNVVEKTHLMKKGSLIGLDLPACQKNPYHWKESNEFNPRRHLPRTSKNAEREGEVEGAGDIPYLGFSLGGRQCIGRRFAEVEMVSFVSRLLSQYKVKVKGEAEEQKEGQGEQWEESRKRMFDTAYEDLTLTPGKFDLILEKRE